MNAATGGPIVIRIQSINSEAKIKCKARGTHQSKSELRTIKKGIRFKRGVDCSGRSSGLNKAK